ncbi:MAG: hypothetical protein V7761_10585 [Amylibacter sp.]
MALLFQEDTRRVDKSKGMSAQRSVAETQKLCLRQINVGLWRLSIIELKKKES